MRSFITIAFVFLIPATQVFSQGKVKILEGKVSYVTSASVYVKFENTAEIGVGDTLTLLKDNTRVPCLVVKNKSTISCVATPISGCMFGVGDVILFEPKSSLRKEKPVAPAETKKLQPGEGARQGRVRGSISAASYSTLSSKHGNDTKMMYRFSLAASHIGGSRFSVETYLNYRQTFLSTDSGRVHPKDVFNIYNLNVRYDATPGLSFVLGRHINPKVSSIGAVDGVLVEKFFGNFFGGVIGGFRPDIFDYTFNKDLLQYGGYVGVKSDGRSMNSTTSIGILEQTNRGEVDRRYAYLQHSSVIFQKLNIFSSFELDIYNKPRLDSSGSPRLTNLFILIGYRVNSKLDFSASYNSRKKILYYQTFKTDIEQMLDDDLARQGLRGAVNFRPIKHTAFGISYNKRFQSNNLNASDNIHGYFSLTKIPAVGGRLSVHYNRNNTNYSATDIFVFRHARQLIKTKFSGDIYYRVVNYHYVDSDHRIVQQWYGITLSYQMLHKLTIDALGEYISAREQNSYRINGRITKRF